MPLYMTQASYTSVAWAALTHNPEDRGEAIGRLAETISAEKGMEAMRKAGETTYRAPATMVALCAITKPAPLS